MKNKKWWLIALIMYCVVSYPTQYIMMHCNLPPYKKFNPADHYWPDTAYEEMVGKRSFQLVGAPVVLPFVGVRAIAESTVEIEER